MIVNSRIAFFDAEFTANTSKDRGLQEMIQCALIIYNASIDDDKMHIIDMDNEALYTYTTYVHPNYNHTLSQYIKQLTHIKQSDIENGKSAEIVFNELLSVCEQYNVQVICTWGPDKSIVKNNCAIIGLDKNVSNKLCDYFTDISLFVSRHLDCPKIVSQHKACKLSYVKEDGRNHNAYNDALNLSNLTKKILSEVTIPL